MPPVKACAWVMVPRMMPPPVRLVVSVSVFASVCKDPLVQLSSPAVVLLLKVMEMAEELLFSVSAVNVFAPLT